MATTVAHLAFAVETLFFFQIGESVIATQRAFPALFLLYRNDAVPDRTKTFFRLVNL